MQKPCRSLSQRKADQQQNSTGDRYLTFTSVARWINDVWGPRVPLSGTHYLYAAPGAGKSSLSMTMAIDLALQDSPEHLARRSLFILTERTEEAVRNHFNQILKSIPISKHQTVLDRVSFTDRVTSLTSLPDFLLGVLSRSPSDQNRPSFIVLDSVNGDGVHPCSRSYEGLYSAFRIARSSGISFMALGHITKSGVNSGPQTIAHSVDTVSILRVGWRRRYFQTLKCRFSTTPSEPTVLEMDSNGCFHVSPHARTSAATVRTLCGGSSSGAEIQVSLSIPSIGKPPKILCPGLPKGNIVQLLQSLERHPDLEFPISYFNTDIQLFAESSFQRTMHFPIAVGALASLNQIDIPSTAYFLGELDLNQRLRNSPLAARNVIVDTLQNEELPPEMTLLCPAGDDSIFREVSGDIQVFGFASFLEFVDQFRSSKERFLRQAA